MWALEKELTFWKKDSGIIRGFSGYRQESTNYRSQRKAEKARKEVSKTKTFESKKER